jgi:hypothetical protein
MLGETRKGTPLGPAFGVATTRDIPMRLFGLAIITLGVVAAAIAAPASDGSATASPDDLRAVGAI